MARSMYAFHAVEGVSSGSGPWGFFCGPSPSSSPGLAGSSTGARPFFSTWPSGSGSRSFFGAGGSARGARLIEPSVALRTSVAASLPHFFENASRARA